MGVRAIRQIELTATEQDSGSRIDVWLSEQVEDLTRAAAQHLLNDGRVTIAGRAVKKNYKLVGNEQVMVELPEPAPIEAVPEDIPISVVYEDEDILVVDKARGMVVHPAAGNPNGTLVNAVLYHCQSSLSGIGGAVRPGIVHRIDKDTSGLLVIAKNDRAHQSLSEQIAAHTARRAYEGIVLGAPKQDEGSIDKPIARHKTDRKKMAVDANGRPAVTHYRVIARYNGYTHIGFVLETGRTHQIRVHMASIGHPLAGDIVYGQRGDRFAKIGGQCLHAKELSLVHPRTGEKMHFTCPLPPYFTEVLGKLGNQI